MSIEVTVDTQHPEYRHMADTWQRCRDAKAGQKAVYAGGAKYLPRLHNEADADYKARQERTPFFGATGRTVWGMRGMLFRKPPVVTIPAAMEEMAKNIDAAGESLTKFAKEIADEILTVGAVGVLVDYPSAAQEGLMTLAEAAGMGLRPVATAYSVESVINWRYAVINNQTRLVMVVLQEDMPASDGGEFAHETQTVYRVLDLAGGAYRQRLMAVEKGKNATLSETFPMRNGVTFDFIPFLMIGDRCAPPLDSLANVNLAHFRVQADYEHGCHLSGLPTLFLYGHHPDPSDAPLYIGGPYAQVLRNSDARAEYVEVKSSFEALRQNLEDKKAEMAVLGARLLESQRSGVEAAETVARRTAGENSILAEIAEMIGEALEHVLEWMAEWSGIAGKIEVHINRDFLPARMQSTEIVALLQAWQAGAISANTLFDNLQEGEVIRGDVTFDEEQARIGEAPIMGAVPPTAEDSANG